jgi:hypothetical protein
MNENYWYDVYHGGDFECPYCKTGLDIVNWRTEYGDPLVGEYPTKCPECGKVFNLAIQVTTTYTPF